MAFVSVKMCWIVSNERKVTHTPTLGPWNTLHLSDCFSESGADAVRSYVERGGAYLGLCAGAYFASGRVEFQPGTDLAVEEDRRIKLFPGTAWGCVYRDKQFCYDSETGTGAADLGNYNGERLNIYYNGGCSFRLDEKGEEVEVVARYEDLDTAPPAVIRTRVGRGVALLSGVHFEIGGEAAEEEGVSEDVVEKLKEGDAGREKFGEELIGNLMNL